MSRESYPISYAIGFKPEAIQKIFNLMPGYQFEPVYFARKNEMLPVISTADRDTLCGYVWGLKLNESGKVFYDISVENIFQHWKVPKKLRIPLLQLIRENRCTAFANCFIVWQDQDKTSTPYCVLLPQNRLFGMAGVWVSDYQKDKTFAMLTQPANSFLQSIGQKRMPVILEEKQVRYWLKGKTSYSNITHQLRSIYSSDKMNAYPIAAIDENSNHAPSKILAPVGDYLHPVSDYFIKEKLVPLGWGRNKPEQDNDPLWKQMGLKPED